MVKRLALLIVFPLLVLACVIGGQAGALVAEPTRAASTLTPSPLPSPSPTLTAQPLASPTAAPAVCRVTVGRLFLRAEPRRDSRALAVVRRGELLTLLDPNPAGEWLNVQAGGLYTSTLAGWVFGEYCER